MQKGIIVANPSGKKQQTVKKKGLRFWRNPLDILVAGVRFELTTFGL